MERDNLRSDNLGPSPSAALTRGPGRAVCAAQRLCKARRLREKGLEQPWYGMEGDTAAMSQNRPGFS